MKVISLFSGIGGFETAAEWMGWTNVVSCEINEFGNHVLQYYWPNAYHHSDIHTLTGNLINEQAEKKFGENWRAGGVILTGGFPCQPFSLAGQRKGTDDNRYLWPEMLRVIREVQPDYVVAENVFGILNLDGGVVFEQVCVDLETSGYEVQTYVLPACGVNAPHRRDRVWFVAYRNIDGQHGSNSQHEVNASEGRVNAQRDTCESLKHEPTSNAKSEQGQSMRLKQREFSKPEQGKFGGNNSENGCKRTTTNASDQGLQGVTVNRSVRRSRKESYQQPTGLFHPNWEKFPTQSPVCNGTNGVSSELSSITLSKWRREAIKAMGNAIVPQVAFQIFKAIQQTHDQRPI
jgi:DNA (cytosine-5)-methyltransferase 1